jgi:hypothetical protein
MKEVAPADRCGRRVLPRRLGQVTPSGKSHVESRRSPAEGRLFGRQSRTRRQNPRHVKELGRTGHPSLANQVLELRHDGVALVVLRKPRLPDDSDQAAFPSSPAENNDVTDWPCGAIAIQACPGTLAFRALVG